MLNDIPIDVLWEFETKAIRAWKAGIRHYSSDALLHAIRWEQQIERGDRKYRCNDHWTAPLARWFMDKHPDKPLFKLRGRAISAQMIAMVTARS